MAKLVCMKKWAELKAGARRVRGPVWHLFFNQHNVDVQQEMAELERVQGEFVGQYGIQDHEIANELLDLQEEIAQV